jgi:hypothetical protein
MMVSPMRILAVALAMAVVLLAVPAHCQSTDRFGSGGKKARAPTEQKSQSRKLVDDKAYKSALDRIQTDKKYDPWRNAR